jgi:hypothetical protein
MGSQWKGRAEPQLVEQRVGSSGEGARLLGQPPRGFDVANGRRRGADLLPEPRVELVHERQRRKAQHQVHAVAQGAARGAQGQHRGVDARRERVVAVLVRVIVPGRGGDETCHVFNIYI